ncbi:MAG: GPR endopeptidase [Lachnospiraceae bacterium]|nr:GPR endopeptidase [Lachnospiraceae bacterium]
MERYIRTDLAVELQEEISEKSLLQGVEIYTRYSKDKKIKETKIDVVDEQGAKILGKPIGTYITLESGELRGSDEDIHKPLVDMLHKNLKELIKENDKILVVGLGNREVTPDALGPYVVDNLYITRHLLSEGIIVNAREISAISPGVMAQTGIETGTILKALCKETNPDIIIAVDALAAREPTRLNSTIQLCDTGISPGAGVGNNRAVLNEETLGVKVIAVGVPTVISVPAIINQAIDNMLTVFSENGKNLSEGLTEEEKYSIATQLIEPDLAKMFVTPKNIDEAVKRISYTISEAINKFLELY